MRRTAGIAALVLVPVAAARPPQEGVAAGTVAAISAAAFRTPPG